MNAIVEHGCIVCRAFMDTYTPAEIHHISGKTKPGAHLNTLPLCYWHHRSGADNHTVTSRHPFKTEFVRRYGSESDLLEEIKLRVGETA